MWKNRAAERSGKALVSVKKINVNCLVELTAICETEVCTVALLGIQVFWDVMLGH
jgi:hypothetical protein